MLICTDHAVVIDCCQAFSFQGWVVPRTAFNVAAPYFRARQDEGQAKKKRKTEPSVAELQTEQHHESIRTLLQTVLDEVQSVWSRVTVETSDRQDEPAVDPINFPALQSLVQASQRFSNIPDVDGDSEATICSLKDPVTEWDTLSVFNRIITNPSKDTRSLTLSPTARYLIPPQASFLMSDMEDMYPLTEYAEKLDGFDFVVLDPPWPNKSVHRSGHYESQDIYDLFKIPLSSLLRSDNSDNPALVAVWITNKPKFKRFVTDKLFPSWGLETVAEWHWLKVTTEGEPVMPLDSPHRKPYEQLVIGRCKQRPSPDIPQTRVIVSVPCKHHSRKPPLREIMKPYLGSEPRCVELFARCLLPGWTSWGNECLKFQNENYFIPDKYKEEDACEEEGSKQERNENNEKQDA